MNKTKPDISVIMSVYNGQEFLRESIESIVNQTFTNIEFIIIDDGSRDNSLKIIEEYQSKDSRIKIINNKKNIGLPASLNKGLKIAKGKYIARQDADDVSHSDRLEKQYEFLEKREDVHLVGTNCKKVDINGSVIYEDTKFSNISDYANVLLRPRAIFPHGTAFMRKEIVRALGGYNENFYYSQDGELWLRFIKNNYKIVVLPEISYSYRITPQKSESKIFIRKEYNKIKEVIYQSDKNLLHKNKIEKRSSSLKKYIMSNSFNKYKNSISEYWFLIARLSIRERSGKLYTLKCLIKSLRGKDNVKNHIKKLLWFFVPLFPYEFSIRFKGKLSFLK